MPKKRNATQVYCDNAIKKAAKECAPLIVTDNSHSTTIVTGPAMVVIAEAISQQATANIRNSEALIELAKNLDAGSLSASRDEGRAVGIGKELSSE